MQPERGISQLRRRDSRYADVNGHRLHVQAAGGDAVSMSSKEFVAPGCAVAADNIDLGIGIPKRGHQVVQQVKYTGIVFVNLASAMVPQVAVELRQGFPVVTFGVAVDDVKALPCVGVEQTQAVGVVRDRSDCRFSSSAADQSKSQHQQQKTVNPSRQNKRLPK